MTHTRSVPAPTSSNVLTSIDQILDMVGKPCPGNCREFGWDGTLRLKEVSKDAVNYECSPFGHKRAFMARVTATRKDIEAIVKAMMEWRSKVPPYESMTEEQRTKIYGERRPFWDRLYLASGFVPPETTMTFKGFCWICLNEVDITLKNNKIEFACASCADIADYD